MRVYNATNLPPDVSNSTTLKQIMDAVKDEADMTGSSFLDDNQLIRWINTELRELYDLLIASFSDYFVALMSGIGVAAGGYAEVPGNYYKCLALYLHDGSNLLRVRKMPLSDLDRYLNTNVVQTDGAYHYRILGRTISLLPEPSSGDSVTIYYVPMLETLVKQEERINLNVPIGWEDFVIAGAAARALAKEESDPGFQLQRKAYIRQHIIEMAERDESHSDAVTDTYRRFGDDYGHMVADE